MATPELMEVHNDDDVVDIINCVALYHEKLRRQWECISSGIDRIGFIAEN